MPCYTFKVGNKKVVCEKPDVVLPDHEAARDYAIDFASELFEFHNELCSGEWHLCSIHVLTDTHEQVFATTVPHAALIERDDMRLYRKEWVNN
jgi:Domain of unknown function (DUF6894)